MKRVTMKVTGKRLNGMPIGDTFTVSETVATSLEEKGFAERVSRASLVAAEPAKPRTYRRRDMQAKD